MKLGIRAGASIIVVAAAIVVALVYTATNRIDMAAAAGVESRAASLHTYRSAQVLKSLIHGYELAINEYYSTVLEYPDYQRKVEGFKASIDNELAALEKRNTRPETEVARLKSSIKEMEGLRLELEGALAGDSKDWDLAREVLYKINLVSIQTVQSPDIIARVAEEQALAMDAALKDSQIQAQTFLYSALGAAIFAVVLAFLLAVRGGMASISSEA